MDVFISIRDNRMIIKGNVGQVTRTFSGTDILVGEATVLALSKMSYGTFVGLYGKMCIGVTNGYYKKLGIVGLGYRIIMLRKRILFRIGFTHYMIIKKIRGVHLIGYKNKLVLFGPDNEKLNAWAANIRDFRRRDCYRGKGIRYRDEQIQFKIGKKK
jgi:large subunit ribosomal protein L6